MQKRKLSLAVLLAVVFLANFIIGCSPSTGDVSSTGGSPSSSNNTLDTESNDSNIIGDTSTPGTQSDSSTQTSTPGTNNPSGPSTTSSENNNVTPSTKIDLKGRTIKILYGTYDAAAEASSAAGKYAIAQRKKIEEKYNCKIVPEAINYETFMPKLLMGDSSGADIIDFCGTMLVGMVKNELVYPLDELVDLSQSHFDTDAMKNIRYFGHYYGAIPERTGFDNIGTQLVMFFNKRLVKNAGYDPDSLYKMQENGTWTWDKFAEIAGKITDTSKGIYGIGNGYRDNYLWMSLMLSNGQDLIANENGKPVFNISNPKSLEALEFWEKISGNLYTPSDTTQDAKFIQGNIGFLPQYVNRMDYSNFKNMQDDYGIICFPKGPSANRYYSPISYITGWSIPANVLRNDDANHTLGKALAAIISDLCKPAVPTNDANKITQITFESLVRDQGSLDMLNKLADPKLRIVTKYYEAVDFAMTFNSALLKVANGTLDINTAVRQNKDSLSKQYQDFLPH